MWRFESAAWAVGSRFSSTTIGALNRGERGTVRVREDGHRLDLVGAGHHGERLLDPAEPLLEPTGRLLDAGDVEPADPLDRDNPLLVEERGRLGDRVVRRERAARSRRRA